MTGDATSSAPPAEAPGATPQAKRRGNPARAVTSIVALLLLCLFAYGILADRSTPYTTQATVEAYMVQIAPEVTGKVVEIAIEQGQPVKTGDLLFRIDPERYQLAVRRAEAQLEIAGQSVGASTASVASAQAALTQAKAERENAREQSDRIFKLVNQGIYAASRGDQAKAARESAEAAVKRAEAELERARQTLGPRGKDNPQVRDAIAALEQAQLDLSRTTIVAPSDGGVPYLELAVGKVVTAGQPALTYVDIGEIWIDAEFRENSLEHIDLGDPVDIVLDIRPGQIFKGTVATFGFAVAYRSIDPQTGLPEIKVQKGWFRDPQPMPLRIAFDPESRPKGLRLGSQATVMVYAKGDPVMNAIGRFWMRVVSWLTYVN